MDQAFNDYPNPNCANCGEENTMSEKNPKYCPSCRRAYAKYLQEGPDLRSELFRDKALRGRNTFDERIEEGFRILNKT